MWLRTEWHPFTHATSFVFEQPRQLGNTKEKNNTLQPEEGTGCPKYTTQTSRYFSQLRREGKELKRKLYFN